MPADIDPEGDAVRRDRRASRHAASRRQIIDETWRLASRQGLTGWTLTDVADAVGMRAPSLYVYFRSKNDLYDALFADGYQALLTAAKDVDATGSPQDVLRRAARFFVDFCTTNPARYQLLFLRTIPGFQPSPASYTPAVETLQQMNRLLANAGAGSPEDLDLYTALITGLASQQISNDPHGTRWRDLTDDALTMFLSARATPTR